MTTVTRQIHFAIEGKRKRAVAGPPPEPVPDGRVPRVSRLMALAIRFDKLLRDGVVPNQSELARLVHVTQPHHCPGREPAPDRPTDGVVAGPHRTRQRGDGAAGDGPVHRREVQPLMRENQSDIAALQHGLKSRRPARDGLRRYTADFDSVSLAKFYRGRSAFLILSGPSLNQVDLSLLNRRGIVTMGVNNSWTIHRPTLWTCMDDPGRFIDTGWKDPGILKIVPTCMWAKRLRIQTTDRHGGVTMRDSAFKVHQMPSVLFFRRADHFDHERFLTGDSIPWGNDGKTADSLGIVGKRSVMLVALRLMHYMGFGTVYLLGCDFKMAPDRRYAFDEHRSKDAIRHNNVLYGSLARCFEALRPHFDQHRFRVVNCSPDSELRAFETMTYEDAVAAASAECAKCVSSQGWYEPSPPADTKPAKEAAR